MNTFFTADLHLGHRNIIKYCDRWDFVSCPPQIDRKDVENMDNVLIDEINKIVQERDRLWIIGDLCMSSTTIETITSYLGRIQCKDICMVWGNHDPYGKTRILLSKLFSNSFDKTTIRINGVKMQLNHEALAIWDCRHYGSWHLYGHSHSRAEGWLDEIMPGRFSMDVGVDNAKKVLGAYRPFAFEEIQEIMSKRSGFGVFKK